MVGGILTDNWVKNLIYVVVSQSRLYAPLVFSLELQSNCCQEVVEVLNLRSNGSCGSNCMLALLIFYFLNPETYVRSMVVTN